MIKLKATQDKYDDICKNVFQYMKNDCRKQIPDVLVYIKKMFNITLDELQTENTPWVLEAKDFTIYLMVNYSSISFEKIISYFIDFKIEDLEFIENDKILEKKYKEKIRNFLIYFRDDYLDMIYIHLVKCEKLSLDSFFNNITNKENFK